MNSLNANSYNREASMILAGVSVEMSKMQRAARPKDGDAPQVPLQFILNMACPSVKETWNKSFAYVMSCMWEWIISFFCKSPDDINQELFRACEDRDFSKAWTLIQKGADVNKQFDNVQIETHDGENDPKIKKMGKGSLLQIACINGDYELASWLVKQKADVNAVVGVRTPDGKSGYLASLLHMAAAKGDHKLAEWLLDNGADIEAPCYSHYSEEGELRNKSQSTPLHWACALENKQASEAMVRFLISRGANVGVTDAGSPLHIACLKGSSGAVAALLEQGVDINIQNEDGRTPLHSAVGTNDQEFVLMLMQQGADANKADNGNEILETSPQTPLQKAYELGHKDLAKAMIRNGGNAADVLKQAVDKKDWEFIHFLLNHGVDLNTPINGKTLAREGFLSGNQEFIMLIKAQIELGNMRAQTLLQDAVDQGDWDFILFLVENGADVNTPFARDNTLLHLASQSDALRPYVKMLLEKGADATLKNNRGQSPLHVATMRGSLGCVQELLTGRPELIDATDEQGRTSLHCAAALGNSQMVQLFAQCGANIDAFANKMTALHFAVSGGHLASATTLLGWHVPRTRKLDAQAAVQYLQPQDEQMKALLKQYGALVDANEQRSSSPPQVGDMRGAFWSLLGY